MSKRNLIVMSYENSERVAVIREDDEKSSESCRWKKGIFREQIWKVLDKWKESLNTLVNIEKIVMLVKG